MLDSRSDSHFNLQNRPRGGSRFAVGKSGVTLCVCFAVLCTLVGASARSQTAVKAVPVKIDACSFLTAEEVAVALKVKVDAGERKDAGMTNDGAYSSTCLWRVESAPGQTYDARKPLGGASFAILNVIAWPKGSGGAGKFLESFREAARHHIIPRAPVPLELGDEALWWGDGVAVRKGDVSFGISVALQTKEHSVRRPMEEALARKILKRI